MKELYRQYELEDRNFTKTTLPYCISIVAQDLYNSGIQVHIAGTALPITH
jgi:hypothetical protein